MLEEVGGNRRRPVLKISLLNLNDWTRKLMAGGLGWIHLKRGAGGAQISGVPAEIKVFSP